MCTIVVRIEVDFAVLTLKVLTRIIVDQQLILQGLIRVSRTWLPVAALHGPRWVQSSQISASLRNDPVIPKLKELLWLCGP